MSLLFGLFRRVSFFRPGSHGAHFCAVVQLVVSFHHKIFACREATLHNDVVAHLRSGLHVSALDNAVGSYHIYVCATLLYLDCLGGNFYGVGAHVDEHLHACER